VEKDNDHPHTEQLSGIDSSKKTHNEGKKKETLLHSMKNNPLRRSFVSKEGNMQAKPTQERTLRSWMWLLLGEGKTRGRGEKQKEYGEGGGGGRERNKKGKDNLRKKKLREALLLTKRGGLRGGGGANDVF